MSDDDCDIFNVAINRVKAVPKESFVPEQDSKQIDYDFINEKPTKGTKTKRTEETKSEVKTKTSKVKKKPSNNKESKKSLVDQDEVPDPSTRTMSPVSQLIYEMEQNKAKSNAKKVESLPVARRTRSSLGKSNSIAETTPESELSTPLPSPPKSSNARGRRKATSNPITVQPEANRNNNRYRRKRQQAAQPAAASLVVSIDAVSASIQYFGGLTHPGRSRRNRQQIAELGARAQVVGSIDLVSAVYPRVEGFIDLDAEDNPPVADVEKPAIREHNEFNDENRIFDINLTWLGEIQKYQLRLYQKFAFLFNEVSKRNDVPIEDVVINLDDHFIKPTETPQSIDLKAFHILSGCAIKSNNNSSETHEMNKLLKARKFQLKIQSDKWKQPLIISMKKSEAFKVLYIKCAEEIERDVHDIKLFFDGELLELDDTPKNQEMEGNEIIDLCFK